jgi:hypothetical protein
MGGAGGDHRVIGFFSLVFSVDSVAELVFAVDSSVYKKKVIAEQNPVFFS